MAANDKMDRGLDDIIAESLPTGPRNSNRRNGGGGRRDRRDRFQEQPRDGIRKSYRNESRSDSRNDSRGEPRNLDGEWVHDRFEENNHRRSPAPRRRRDSIDNEAGGAKLRVENIHWDLTEEDLDELFKRIGPITKLQLRYDRSGRSEGTAFVTYELKDDALEAIKQFDGANANGQPIRLNLMSGGRGNSSRNPFETAVMPGRPLADRITAPGGNRSHSPSRQYTREDAARKGIDRYIPGEGANRSRSPAPRERRERGGRRPGARREGGGGRGDRDQEGGRGGRGQPRGKKTQEELDAEMEDYFGGNADAPSDTTNVKGAFADTAGNTQEPAAVQIGDDVDMIE